MTENLSKEEVDIFVEKKVSELVKQLDPGKDEYIYINRCVMGDNKGIFVHNIHICPMTLDCINQLGDAYDDSELFTVNGPNLYLYLKGRMLIQTTTTWVVWRDNPFKNQYEITCEYLIKGVT